MEAITKIPGLQHISEDIFNLLDTKSLLNCGLVNKSWRNILDQPIFLEKIERQKIEAKKKEQIERQKIEAKKKEQRKRRQKIEAKKKEQRKRLYAHGAITPITIVGDFLHF